MTDGCYRRTAEVLKPKLNRTIFKSSNKLSSFLQSQNLGKFEFRSSGVIFIN
jgi:hypothetical protein